MDKKAESLLTRSAGVDRHMQEYEQIVKREDKAISVLSSSSLVQFFVSAMVLLVALGGAAINFSLIARPMAEMVGGTSFIGVFKTADIAALVIIMVEISMGLFLMESLRITRLFPVIGALPDKMRVRMIWITFSILLLLASIEAGLAYMREVLLQDELATSALLRGGEAAIENNFLWITTAAQMGMGFILPFALVFVAIPLETFMHSLRTVVGLAGIGLLRSLSLVLRVLGNGFRHLGTLTEEALRPAAVRAAVARIAARLRMGRARCPSRTFARWRHESPVDSRRASCWSRAANPRPWPATRACICCSTPPALTAASCARPRT